MYRSKTDEEISGLITIYKNNDNKKNIDIPIDEIKVFLNNPKLPHLIKILKGKDKTFKKAILTSLNCNINYSSIKPFINNDTILFNLLSNIELNPIYNEVEIKAIMEYIKTKSNTSIIAKKQTNEVKKFFNDNGFLSSFSSHGVTDIDFKGRKAAAKSDGIVLIDDVELIVYLRYGSTSGGSQNDRWRGMFSIASRHKDKLFLFVVDGVEALQQYKLCKDEFERDNYNNAVWSTVKYLNFMEFNNFTKCIPKDIYTNKTIE